MSKGLINVELKNYWSDPNSKFWDPGRHEMEGGLIEFLPTTALILDEDGEVDEDAMKEKRDREAGVKKETLDAEKVTADKTVQVPLKK